MTQKQIESLRQWACEVTHVTCRLAKDNGMPICAETVGEYMNKLNEVLEQQPEE